MIVSCVREISQFDYLIVETIMRRFRRKVDMMREANNRVELRKLYLGSSFRSPQPGHPGGVELVLEFSNDDKFTIPIEFELDSKGELVNVRSVDGRIVREPEKTTVRRVLAAIMDPKNALRGRERELVEELRQEIKYACAIWTCNPSDDGPAMVEGLG
jgi:hypothetical protein